MRPTPNIIRLGTAASETPPPIDARTAAKLIEGEVRAGHLGLAAVILRTYTPETRDQILDLLEVGARRRAKHPGHYR